ncbi:YcaO-like family protein [Streptacidiphilus anmyonensis]|uniref:YcaO-like family protein n=1 Tax=Streptacidiphilus anmyonensis TaxID=405782 RepID=UPI000A02ACC2|nr:YcaO-like family protein [Streptacidiphilus anmyonensis]
MSHSTAAPVTDSLDALVSPYGVVSGTWTGSGGPGARYPFVSGTASIGSGRPGVGSRQVADQVCSGGRSWDSPETARFISIAEGAERYAGMDNLGEERIVASARDLAGECLEPDRYPRCSEAEYSRPGCPVRPFSMTAPIRWTRGLDLATGEPTWVPAIMACYGLRGQDPQDEFCMPISTGYAVHTDPVRAVLGGICEVIERDALSVTWLQQLSLPLVDPAVCSERTAELVEWNRRCFIRSFVFDATLDLGVPTAYVVLAADHDRRASRLVAAATGRTLEQAAESALADAMRLRGLFHDEHIVIPDALEKINALEDGARYMGCAERSAAFDFLIEGAQSRNSRTPVPLPEDPVQALDQLTQRLDGAGMRVVVVDRTTRELASVGLTAVCVVIPDLQPFSPHPLAQFTAHPRLYNVPERMGYPVRGEKELNPWPQPFA